MEGDCQSMNPALLENQNDAEQLVNGDDIPEDAKLVLLEISKMKAARQKSLENTANLQRKLEEEQKAIQKQFAAKTKLEKEIVQLQCKLNDRKYQNGMLKMEMGKMREMSTEIGNFCVRNERTLQQSSKDKTSTVERNQLLKTKIRSNLVKFEETLIKKQCEVRVMKETVLSQQAIYKENLEKRELECLEMNEKLKVSNNELESIKKQFDELSQANNSFINNITDTTKDNQQLEERWQRKQKQSDDLLQQMEKEQEVFEQRKEEISNSQDEVRHILQKQETEIDGIQRGIKNQTEYNKNFREKLKAKTKEIADLQLQYNKLEVEQKEKQVQLASDEQSLTAALNSKLEEEQNATAVLSEERKILNETEEQIKDARQINEKLIRHIETQENILAELNIKQINQLQAITAFEQELLAPQFELNNLKEELGEWQMKLEKYEFNIVEAIANKTAATKTKAVEVEEIKTKEQETTTAIVMEMDAIKGSFDAETAQETADFEEKKKQLQLQINTIEMELTNMRNLQVQLDDELQQLNKDCDDISIKMKDQESHNQASFNTPEVDFEPPALPLPPSTSRGSISTVGYASTPSTSTLILPPTGPVKHRAFDELSGSSAEGNVVTYQQILEYKREKQRRRQLKEQRRLQSKKSSTSHSKSPGK